MSNEQNQKGDGEDPEIGFEQQGGNEQEEQQNNVDNFQELEPYNNDDTKLHNDNVDPQVDDPEVFMTQQKQETYVWKSFDFLFPAGKLSKLVKVNDFWQKTFPFMEILSKLKLDDGFPVVNLIGAKHNFDAKKEELRGKFYAGIARACFNTDAVIVDSSITTGVESFAIRRGIKVIGIAPENEITFPKLNPTQIQKNELSNGHTHIFLLNNLERNLKWGGESYFKIQLCKKIAEGKLSKTQGRPRCKIVNVVFLDSVDCLDEVREAIINKLPLIIVRGSRLCNLYLDKQKKSDKDKDEDVPSTKAPYDDPKYIDAEFEDIINDKDAHVYPLDTLNSEEIAQYIHFFLTYTPY